jgi:hypothetical protein
MSGRDIAKRAKRAPPGARAALAVRLTNGVAITALTNEQAAKVMKLHVSSVSLAKRLPPSDLEDVRRGRVSLRQARAKQRRKPDVSKSMITEFLALAGVEEVLAEIDRMTAPASAAAE